MINSERWIEKVSQIHNNQYDYSLVEYSGCKNKVKIICKIHGTFEQTPDNHSQGKGCPMCNGGVSITTNEFIKRAKEVHGDLYDYSLVNYINSKTKVKIICKVHGIFKQQPNNHLFGQTCSFCNDKLKLDLDKFIKRAKEVHGDLYDYSLVNYINIFTKVIIKCSKHGNFKTTPNSHINHKSGCPKCKYSKGELKIEQWLKEHNINFISQKRFPDCRNKNPLPFDFYLPEHNTCIEFDGEQHFTPYRFRTDKDKFIERLKQTQLHDKIKDEYCIENNIHLLRIPYTKILHINDILENFFKF